MHQLTNFDIRECERRPVGLQGVMRDLTQNWEWAEQAIAVADRFFQFDPSRVRFSGYVTGDDNGKPLKVEIWNDVHLAYIVDFNDAGVQGILYADMNDIGECLGQDMLGAIKSAVNEVRHLKPDCPRYLSVAVDNYDLTVKIDLRP